ncbi:hypothetical protein [Pontibacter fetidus]|uniref:Uncharacterized protein n=1 Tax=Pontibacter fetidus TaxID=2700082 RepID=A0A6B2H1C4_9BACT|nr:hypothetical protein [Pontibacter fetidus]NDK55938.1 hypothetical protein [Pontibacter fetidus]
MNSENRNKVLELVDAAHAKVESFYPETAIHKGTPEWLEKRRLLLADLALHLTQDALKGETINEAKLRNHLFAILKISAEFFPQGKFEQATALLDETIATLQADKL